MYNNFSSKKTKKVISALLASALVVTSAPITADAATSKVLGVKKTFTVAGTKVTGLSKAEKKVVKVTIKNKKVTVKGLKAGKVTFKIGKKAYTVKVGATNVKASAAATSLKVNATTKLSITAVNGAKDKLTVKTSNNSIVKISKSSVTANASGKASITLRGLAVGTSKITVTSKNTGKTASVKINVVADEVVTQAPVVSDSPVVSENPSESQAPVVSGDPSTSQAPATSNDPTVTTGAATAVPTAAPTTTSSAIIVAANAVVGNTSVALPATNVNAASKIYLTFDKDIDASSVISGNITVTKDGVKQLIAVTYNSAKKAAVIGMKTSVFDAGATYNVTVDGVKGTDGTAVKKYTTTFTVAQNAIVEAATYDKTGKGISLNGSVVDSEKETISITFNRAMDITSAQNTANYRIYDVTDKKYIDKTDMSAETNANGKTTATFKTSALVAQHEYTLTVDGVVSLDGLAMLPTTCKFFFGVTPLSFVDGTTYTGEEKCVPNNTAGESVYGSLTAFKGHTPFTFKGQLTGDADVATVNADTVVLTDKATGNVVAANVTYENGSRYVILTPTADLKQDTTYVVTVDGVATDKGLSIAKSTFTFTVGDYQAPTIVSVTPENGEDKVAVNKNIVITFSEKMETLSSLIGKIELKDLTTNTVITPISNYYAASLSQDGKVLTLTNTKDLEVGTTYQVTVKGDGYTAASARDAAGNQLVSDYVTKFATVDATTTYVKAVTKNTSGTYASTDSAIENGLTKVGTSDKFYFTFDKALLALEDQPTTFKVALDVKAPGATVWTTAGATNALTNSNKTIRVIPTLAADKLYRITISGAKDINGNDVAEQVFTFTTGSAPSLENTFPEQYAKDVTLKNDYVFVTLKDASDIDVSTLNAQTVKLIKSSDKSVAPYTLVSAQYKASEKDGEGNPKPFDSVTTNTATTFTATDGSKYAAGQLIKVGDKYAVVSSVEGKKVTLDREITVGSPVAVYSVQGVVYKLNDDAQLEAKTQYEFSISGVKDVAGNEIDAATKKFTTAGDVQKLKFVSTSVEDGSVGVAVNTDVKLTFNESIDIDKSKALDGTLDKLDKIVTVKEEGAVEPVTTVFNISEDNGVVTVSPKGLLKAGKKYTITINKNASSSNSGAFADDNKTITFQTELTASVKAKLVSAVALDANSNGILDSGEKILLTFDRELSATAGDIANYAVNSGYTLGGSGKAAELQGDKKTVVITAGVDVSIIPGITTIKATGVETVETINGIDVDDSAVTIKKQ